MAAAVLAIGAARAQDDGVAREDMRLGDATQVLQDLYKAPDQHVPDWLLQRAYGIAVIPNVIKAAFIFGGRGGKGVLTVRNASGRFSDPVFITLGGGSVGWQIGASSTDVVLVLMTPRSVEHFSHGKFTLGADASVAAGPVGRQTEAQGGVSAEIYSYSRSRGLFAGVALDGTVLAVDGDADRAFYGQPDVTADMITHGKVTTTSAAARHFVDSVTADVGGQATGEPSAVGASLPGSSPSPASAPTTGEPAPGASSSGAQSFPLPDSHPGGEPGH
ncbi:MAG TPA: lipid-binding SYLF domain-containing protein [Steroidobacteraceae bacterium]|nr:lipid-binding SYLF domain-containing protein [Steroidobacteraceae bacterium]